MPTVQISGTTNLRFYIGAEGTGFIPQYAIISSHPPGDCPVSCKGAREWMNKMAPQVETVGKKHGVKFVLPWLHLDPAHKGLMVLQAGSAKSVRDFLVEAGLFHFLTHELYLTTPINDLLKQTQNIPTIYP